MKPKTIVDAYDHYRTNDEIDHEINQSNYSTSNLITNNTSSETKTEKTTPTSCSRYYEYSHSLPRRGKGQDKPMSSTAPYKNIPPHVRIYSRRGKQFPYSPYRYNSRNFRGGRFSDIPYRNNKLRRKNYYPASDGRKAQKDWIDGICWFHYTKGQEATSCLDSEKCQGYKSFQRKK